MLLLRRFLHCRSAAASLEYGMIAALISILIIGAATSIGVSTSQRLDPVPQALNGSP